MKRKIALAVLAAAILFLIHPIFGQVSHGLNLSWTLSSSTGVGGQNVYRGTVSGGPYTKLTATALAPTVTTYLDYGAPAHQFTVVPGDLLSLRFNTQAADTLAGVKATLVID